MANFTLCLKSCKGLLFIALRICLFASKNIFSPENLIIGWITGPVKKSWIRWFSQAVK